jgi:hypothetical protein
MDLINEIIKYNNIQIRENLKTLKKKFKVNNEGELMILFKTKYNIEKDDNFRLNMELLIDKIYKEEITYEDAFECLIKELKLKKKFLKLYKLFTDALCKLTGKNLKDSLDMLELKDVIQKEYYDRNCIELCLKKNNYACICGWCLNDGLNNLCIYELEGYDKDILIGVVCNENLAEYIALETDEEIKERLDIIYKRHKIMEVKLDKKKCYSCNERIVKIRKDPSNNEATHLKNNYCEECINNIHLSNGEIQDKCIECNEKYTYNPKYKKCFICRNGKVRIKYSF